jgi:TetR/AcrR family transcriptional repressor of mexJK operon
MNQVRASRSRAAAADDKSGKILVSARAVFMARGFEATTMDVVALRAHVSKATVYAHFGSKAAMFAAVVRSETEALRHAIETSGAQAGVHFAARLETIAQRFVGALVSRRALTLHRIVIAESRRFPELGRAVASAVRQPILDALGEVIGQACRHGEIACDAPERAAVVFVSLVKGDWHTQCLLDPQRCNDAESIAAYVRDAVRAFVDLYRPCR